MFFYYIFIHILSYDVWFYISHLILHIPWMYKNIHYKHHNIEYKTMNFLDATTGHIIETVFQGIGIYIPLFFVPLQLSPFVIAYIFIGLRGGMRHDHRCSWLIGNHHLLHHKYPKYNFGEYWIDRMLGTLCPKSDEYIYGVIYT